ncbi:hypothetical protein [Methanocella sp. MCL-LM]
MVKVGTDLIKVGIIGGTGIYNPSGISVETRRKLAALPERQTMTK